MTEEELQAIEARANAATPGPWAWEPTGEKCNSWCMGTVYPAHEGRIVEVFDEETQRYREKPEVVDYIASGGDSSSLADPNFIAHARTDVPALIAEVRMQRARADAATREADRLRHGAPVEGDFVCPDAMRAEKAEHEAGLAVAFAQAAQGREAALVAKVADLEATLADFRAVERGRTT